MRLVLPLLFALLAALATPPVLAESAVKAAAERHVAGVIWREASVVAGDFNCAGHSEQAILGTTPEQFVVAVFVDGLGQPPQVLRFARERRNVAAASIAVELLAASLDEIESQAGMVPPGYQRSLSCQGLRLSDGASDAAHIYWDHNAKRLDSWSQ